MMMISRTYLVCLLFLIGVVYATDEAGTKYLEEKAAESDVVSLPSGLLYKVLEKGSGAFHPTVGSPCVCHYAGTLIDGTEFDSSYSRGKPATFAPDQVIEGWTEAMQLMVEGDKWELYIPSELGYGSRGSSPKIPGDSALVFTIEMLEIKGDKVPVITEGAGEADADAEVGATALAESSSIARVSLHSLPFLSTLIYTLSLVF